jgi:hypothetical protein
MSGHPFNFGGGSELATMGASWFVSYSYYRFRDKTHMNWNEVSTGRRIGDFNKTKDLHQFWLQQVLDMDDAKLKINEIGLTGPQVRQMAEALLAGNRGATVGKP